MMEIHIGLASFDPERCPVLVAGSVRAIRAGKGPARQCPYRPPDGEALCIMHQESLRKFG